MTSLRIVIVGGGYAGASAAVQLVRKTSVPLAITIVEPREELGRGLAYSTSDPSFRLNAHAGMHSIDASDPGDLIRWSVGQGLPQTDPECVATNGQLFVRRMDFGRYLSETVARHADHEATRSAIRHHRANALRLVRNGAEWQVCCDDGTTLDADRVILGTGNPPARLPTFLKQIEGHSGLVAQPLEHEALAGIDPAANVLVVGAGLTALDMIASLLRRGHRGAITAMSRRGLRPRAQPPAVFAPPVEGLPVILPLDLIDGPLQPYADTPTPSTLALLRGLRAHIAAAAAQGLPWQMPFDLFAATAGRVWPRLKPAEQARFLRHLKPLWDVHRFRTPPMTAAVVQEAERAGQVRFRTAAVSGAQAAASGLAVRLKYAGGDQVDTVFDVIINCAGFEAGNDLSANPLLAALYDQGMIAPHPSGIGLVLDQDCRPLDQSGQPLDAVYVFGSPSAGQWGDPLGALFIAARIHHMVPTIVAGSEH